MQYQLIVNSEKKYAIAKTKRNIIIAIIILVCGLMSVVDAVIQPGYFIKSIIKIVLFLLLPVLYSVYDKNCNLKRLFKPDKKGIFAAILLGVGVYAVVLGAYFAFRGIFDFSALTSSLTSSTGINKNNFIFVAVYISFANLLFAQPQMAGGPEPEERCILFRAAAVSVKGLVEHHFIALQLIVGRIDA